MTTRVTARAHANIALVKYWGKQPVPNNVPATPSLSFTLKALRTDTTIEKSISNKDKFFLDDSPADKQTAIRLNDYLNYWRDNNLIDGYFNISSVNNFPTKAGLASSSSGFAALAVGLSAFDRQKLSRQKLSRLARIGSGSAARSIFGGLAAFPLSSDPAARMIIPPDEIQWGMVIAIVDEGEKKITSRDGMEICRKHSPYYKSWIARAVSDYKRMLSALRNLDFTCVGEIAEANALAMHACMISARPSLLYWTPTTLEIIRSARRLRNKGLETYVTIDAGPHVVLLGKKDDLNNISRHIRRINGVKSVIKSGAGDGAMITKWN